MLIDLSSWYKDSLAQKIELIQDAIEGRNYLEFQYYGPSGESKRTINHTMSCSNGRAGMYGVGASNVRNSGFSS